MKYEINLGNRILECTMRDGYYYCHEDVTEGEFGRNVEISQGEFKMTVKRPRVVIEKTSGGCRIAIREKTKEERESDTRKNKSKLRNEWIAENYERVSCTLPIGTKERIASLGFSVNGFINEAVKVMLEAQEDT